MAKRKKDRRRRARSREEEGSSTDAPLMPEVLLPEEESDEGLAPEAVTFTEAEDAAETGVILRPNALQRYFADIRRSKPLSREEEHELAVRYHEHGDLDAAYALLMANLRLVVKIAMEYQSVYMNLLDLIQEGNIGLMEAVKRFNPYREVKLSTYASWWIRAFILRYIINNFRLVKIGTTRAQRKLFFNLNKERRRLEAMGYDASPRLLASKLDVTEKEVEEMSARMAQPATSLDQPMAGEGQASLLDMMEDAREGPEEMVAREEIRRRALAIIEELAETLPEKERAILERRLLAEEPETLEQIGESFGVTKERIRQLEARLMGRLRETLKARLLPEAAPHPPEEEGNGKDPGGD